MVGHIVGWGHVDGNWGAVMDVAFPGQGKPPPAREGDMLWAVCRTCNTVGIIARQHEMARDDGSGETRIVPRDCPDCDGVGWIRFVGARMPD